MKVSQLEMAHVVRASLQVPGMPVLTSNQCYLLAQELNRNLAPAQQGQGEPAAFMYTRPEVEWPLFYEQRQLSAGWKESPLYTHADPAEVERLQDQLKSHEIELKAVIAEHDETLAKLAEAQALLREFVDCPWIVEEATIPKAGIEAAPKQVVGTMHVGLLRLRKVRAWLSASTEPVSPMAKIAEALREKGESERAEFDRRVQSGEWGPLPDREFCAVCDGSGWKEESRAEICPYCNGHGYKEVCAILCSSAESEVKS